MLTRGLDLLFDSLKGLVAYVMLYLARVGLCRLAINTDGYEKVGKDIVPVKNLRRNGEPGFGKREIAVGINGYVSAAL